MLNRVVMMGRVVAEPEVRRSNETSILPFTLAVERNYETNGKREADFIDCIAFNKTCDFIAKYFSKGSLICVEGELRKRSYTNQNGEKRYITEVVVSKAYFTGEKKKDAQNGSQSVTRDGYTGDEFMTVDDFEPLPF